MLDFSKVLEFEEVIANFFGAPYCVSTDSCTHAIELCLRHKKFNSKISIPTNTYISIPFTLIKLGLVWKWESTEWQDKYLLGGTNIYDAAVLWKKSSYVAGSLMCLSFQSKKHLGLGRGGAILLDNYGDYVKLKKMASDGRDMLRPWATQTIDSVGYHYYITPETAQSGMEKFYEVQDLVPRKWTHKDYPYLPSMPVFK